MRRRSFLVGLGTVLAGCSQEEVDNRETVTPVTVPGDATPTPATDVLSAASFPGLDPENREPRYAETLRLGPTNGRSVLRPDDRANLLPVGGSGFPNISPTGVVFASRASTVRLNNSMLSSMPVYGGSAGSDYDDPGKFVDDTDFDHERLVVLTAGVGGTPARQSVSETALTNAGRLFCAVEILTGTWDDLIVLTTLARIEVADGDGLLVDYRHRPRGDEPTAATYADP